MKYRKNSENVPLGTKINRMSPEARHVLLALNGANDYEYGDYDSYLGRRQRIYWRERAMSRTESGRHYRMAPQLARLLLVETVEPVGAHPTEPPTVLATAEETLAKLEQHVAQSESDPQAVVLLIRDQLGIPRGPALWNDLMHGHIR